MAFVVFSVSSGFGEIRGKSMGSVFVYTKVHPYQAVSSSFPFDDLVWRDLDRFHLFWLIL